ncbi:PH domain-containing protein [Actinoallomurus acaciae]|uniref:PH domain-containing protein n=1 Tax=Actinoallomurus acaciae TaxID=502577 RepID=A0ABV5YPI5_9ACTN
MAWRLSLVLLPIAAFLAWDRARSLGHALIEASLVSRRGSLVRRRSALACEGVIGWNLRRSFFQRRAGLATLVATTAAGRQRIDVQDVPLGEALRLADEALPGLLTFLDWADADS